MRRKNLSLLVVAVLGMLTLSSCNRGYGCPSNFSLNNAFEFAEKLLSIF